MFNIGLFELVFFVSFALIFLGPDKLLTLLKTTYQCYQKLKFFLQNFQNDIERELKLTELQQNLESEINKVRELEKVLSQKIHMDIHPIFPVYISFPYNSLEKIESITSAKILSSIQLYPKSYSTINKDLYKKSLS